MGRERRAKFIAADFETTVYKEQVRTDVWAAACVEFGSEDVHVFGGIEEQFEYYKSLDCNLICYYHNLKFDGSFWLSYLLGELGYKQGYVGDDQHGCFMKPADQPNKSVTYNISATGQWYRIVIKVNDRIIELRDSFKLLPFTLKKIGKSFQTKHQKLDMEYEGFRYPGCRITDNELAYIKNDVLVLKEALEFMYQEGHKKLTIGACCLTEYRKLIGNKYYETLFPNLYKIKIPEVYGASSAGEYIHKSYRGGWCYVVEEKAGKKLGNGMTADVNSLYPSMMSSESGNAYPVGNPTFWRGEIPKEAMELGHYYFVRIRTRFYLKDDMLPTIQVKGTFLYKSTEMLKTSDIYNKEEGKYYTEYIGFDGNLNQALVEMTLTQTDYELINRHYRLEDTEILDGCYFESKIGIFDPYIEKYKKIKTESKGAVRELAKLFLNNLYGKMAASPISNFKKVFIKEDGSLGFHEIYANDKVPGYIACGSAITSYSRCFTITAAQANYYGPDEEGFVYADTDSIHCDMPVDEVRGIRIDDKNFCCWKIESEWDQGYFVRQKTYIEHIVKEDGKELESPVYNIKCAGMPDKCKQLFEKGLETGIMKGPHNEDIQIDGVESFRVGLEIGGKLIPKQIAGGVLLIETTFRIR